MRVRSRDNFDGSYQHSVSKCLHCQQIDQQLLYCIIIRKDQFTTALTTSNMSGSRSQPLKKFLQICQN